MAKFRKLTLLCTAILACGVMASATGCALSEYIPDLPDWLNPSTGVETPAAVKYTIKFVNADGTVLQESEVEEGQMPTYTGETPVKAATAQYSYTFAGWDSEIVAATADVVYTATFTETVNNYIVSFDTDGGSSVEAKTVPYGTSASGLEQYVSEKTGYTFAGWTLENGDAIPENAMVTGNVTLKAKWVVNNYIVSFDTDGGSAVEAKTVPYGTPISGLDQYTSEKLGYTFAGWALENGDATVTGNATVKAVWTANTNTAYVVKHYQQNLANEGYTEITQDIENKTGTTAMDTAAVAKTYEGFTAKAFDQVTIKAFDQVTIKADGSAVVEIYYDRNIYTVSITVSEGNVDVQNVTVPYGTPIIVEENVVIIGDTEVTATEQVSGSYAAAYFQGFTGVTETVSEDMTIKANFKKNTYLATGSSLVHANFTGNEFSVVPMVPGLTSDGGADISKKPEGAKGNYTSVISITPKQWETNVGFDITDILANIDKYDNHYLTLYVASYFYSARGAFLTTLNGTGEYVWGSGNENASSAIPYANFNSGATAGWVALNIEMSEIKAMMQTNEGKNYIVYHFAPHQNEPIYIYSLEVTEKQTIKAIEGYLPDNNCYYTGARTNTIKTVPMVAGLTSDGGADISQKPANAKANYTSCLSVTPGTNMWETAVSFDITDILANIDAYEGKYLTLFAASYFYGARGAYLTTFNANEGKVVGISQTEYATGGMAFDCASGATDGWKEYKIPVSALKEAMEDKAGANYITYHFRTNENIPVYIYSLEITD